MVINYYYCSAADPRDNKSTFINIRNKPINYPLKMYGDGQPRFEMMQARPPRFNNYYNTQSFRQRAPFNYQRQNYYNGSPISSIEHWCETCDRSFPTVDLLEKHLQQHQKCNIDGCQFVAHPKVVTRHIQMQHASGLYKKIANLNNPEEIQKWREERKRKYPTKINIEKKAAERREKFDRGEKMGLKSGGPNRNFKMGAKKKSCLKDDQPPKRHRPNVRKNAAVNNDKKVSVPKKIHEVLPSVISRKLKPFTGIQDIIMIYTEEDEKDVKKSDLDIEDEDDIKVPNTIVELDKSEPKVCGALSSLMCDYESSEDEFPEEKLNKDNGSNCSRNDKKIPCSKLEIDSNLNNHLNGDKIKNDDIIKKAEELKSKANQENKVSTDKCIGKGDDQEIKEKYVVLSGSENVVASKCIDQSDGEGGPEEVKISKPNEIDAENNKDKVSINHNRTISKKSNLDNFKVNKFNYRKPKPRVPSTLLRKLLHREIQQERNVILQCIRYVLNNHYFDKIDTEQQEPE